VPLHEQGKKRFRCLKKGLENTDYKSDHTTDNSHPKRRNDVSDFEHGNMSSLGIKSTLHLLRLFFNDLHRIIFPERRTLNA